MVALPRSPEASSPFGLAFRGGRAKTFAMVELEIYAAGVRNADKMMALALELDSLPGLRYKVDVNHDIIYMEFNREIPPISAIQSIFRRTGLEAKFVGQLPPELDAKKSTQRLPNVSV